MKYMWDLFAVFVLFQVFCDILLAWTWKPRFKCSKEKKAMESNIVSILWGKTVHPLSKMCFLVAVPYFPVFPCMSKLWHLKSLRSKCFVQFWTSTTMEFRSLSNGQTLSSVPWIRALPSTLLSLQPLVPPTSNVYLDLRRHIPTAEIKYWFLRKP